MKKVWRMWNLFTLLALLPSLFSGCKVVYKDSPNRPGVLRDLTYSAEKEERQYTIFLEENGEQTPYLVLTDQYNGGTDCLLLRKYVLDEPRIFHTNASFSGYYAGSDIDQFLNDEFSKTLPVYIQDCLCTSQITVTSKSSLGCCGRETETAARSVFLLSAVEAGGLSSATILREGTQLAYFFSSDQRIARTSDGVPASWWLRTPNTWYDNVVCGVDQNGAIGIGGVGGIGETDSYKNGVRPAFCLDAETKITESSGAFYITDLWG